MVRKTFLILLLSFVSLFAGQSPFGKAEAFASNETEYATLANHLATLLQSARLVVARNQDVINTNGAKLGEPIPEGATVSYKGFVPAVFGRLVTQEFSVRTGIALKQTTLGKGRFGQRGVYNTPDQWERGVLKKFESRSYPTGVGYGEFANLEEGQKIVVYRYMLPLYIEKACLLCHGDPANSPTGDGLDIAGYPMEGYKEGELRGAISVTIPVRESQTFSVNSRYFLELEEIARTSPTP